MRADGCAYMHKLLRLAPFDLTIFLLALLYNPGCKMYLIN